MGGVSGGRAKVGLGGVLMMGEGVRSDKLLLLAIWYEVDRRGKKRIDVEITRRKNGLPNRVSSVFSEGPRDENSFPAVGLCFGCRGLGSSLGGRPVRTSNVGLVA
jgi:hypothetical protein